MPFGRSLLQKESLYRVSGEERSPDIFISFHSSGSTSNQWRKLKNLWFPGRTPFRPSCCGTGKKKRFFAQLAHSAGPTCILYLAEEASDRLEFLPSWDSMDQDLLSLYGQYGSTLVDHMDVEKASDFFELETSLFHFYLPTGAAIGIGNVFSSLIHSVARNPSLAKQSFGYAILGFALTEAIALFAPMMAFLILFAAMSLSDFWLSDHTRNSIMYLLIVFLPLLGSGVAVAPGASACYLRISPWISSEMFDASWGFFGDREVWERSWSGKAKTAPRIWVARGRLCPDGGALWGRAQPNRDSTPPTSSAPLYRLNHSFGLVGGTGEPRELVRCVGQRARSGHMISAVDQVGEPCDGKPSRTVRRALNSNERFTTTSLRARGARSIRKLVRLVINF
ncbi:hypothetical protein ACFE04_019676 [Oxalis oulophora]